MATTDVFSIDETPEPPKKQAPKDLPEPEKITVHVTRSTATGRWSIKSSHPYGSVSDIMNRVDDLNVVRHAHDYRYETIENVMAAWHGTITADQWQRAIVASIIALQQKDKPHDPTEVVNLTDTYMSMGNQLFKLQPVRVIKANGALAAVRARATAAAKLEAERYIEDARRSAKGVIDEANKRLKEATDKLTVANRTPTPPAWAQGYPLMLRSLDHGNVWFIGVDFNFSLKEFHYSYNFSIPAAAGQAARLVRRTNIWNALAKPPFKVKVWIPCDSSDTGWFVKCIMDTASPALPHIKYSHACGTPAMGPARITGLRDIGNATAAIADLCTVANLNSLLHTEPHWDKRIADFVPPALWEVTKMHNYASSATYEQRLRELRCDRTEDHDPNLSDEFTAPANNNQPDRAA